MKQNNVPAAQAQLSSILQLHSDSEEASMMMANLMCEKMSFQSAMFHYKQILEKNPLNFEVMSQFIDIARRMDKLDDVTPFFDAAFKAFPRCKGMPGYRYCQGLYLRYELKLM